MLKKNKRGKKYHLAPWPRGLSKTGTGNGSPFSNPRRWKKHNILVSKWVTSTDMFVLIFAERWSDKHKSPNIFAYIPCDRVLSSSAAPIRRGGANVTSSSTAKWRWTPNAIAANGNAVEWVSSIARKVWIKAWVHLLGILALYVQRDILGESAPCWFSSQGM